MPESKRLFSADVFPYVAAYHVLDPSPPGNSILPMRTRRYCLPLPSLNPGFFGIFYSVFYLSCSVIIWKKTFVHAKVVRTVSLFLCKMGSAETSVLSKTCWFLDIILCCYCRSVSTRCTISLRRRSSQQVHYLIMDPKRSPTPPSAPQPTLAQT